MMYVWKTSNDSCVYEDSIERAKALKIVQPWREPDFTVTDTELEEKGSLIRVIDGKLFLGFTDDEKLAQKKSEIAEQVKELKDKLFNTDYVAAKIAEGAATKEEYAEVLEKRASWRAKINELEEQ